MPISAFAQQQNKPGGHYAIAKIVQTTLQSDSNYGSQDDKDTSFALEYRYIWNFDNNILLLSGVDYTHFDNTVSGEGSYAGTEFQLQRRYGVKAGIGYEFKNWYPYANLEFGAMHYYEHNATNNGSTHSDWNGGLGFSIGSAIHLSQNTDLLLEYEENENIVRQISDGTPGSGDATFTYNSIKIGVAYKF